MRSFFIIANGESGGGKARRVAAEVDALLNTKGVTSQLHFTSSEQTVDQLVDRVREEHTPQTCLVICGGDGSIQRCVDSVLSTGLDVTIGLAPAGTCNDFSHALGVRTDPEAIVDVLLNGVERQLDVGLAGQNHFCTIAAVGLEATVSRYLRNNITDSPSRWLFIVAAGLKLLMQKPLNARVTINGNTESIDAINLLVANTPYYGGHIPIAPRADPSDARFELLVFKAMSRLRSLITLPLAISGRHMHRKDVCREAIDAVTIETDPPMEVWADGEPVGMTPMNFRIVSKAIRVLVPS